MNLLNNLTIKNLKLNKKRTIVTIIGIVLSVALITAVASIYTSGINSLINFEINEKGNFHVAYYNVPSSELDFFKNNRGIDTLNLTKNIGYAKIDSKNEYKPYAFVKAFTKSSLENLSVKLVEGRLPENENEIVIPTHLKTNGRLELKVGDSITLDIGKRVDNEGYELNQNNPYYSDNTSESITDTDSNKEISSAHENSSNEAIVDTVSKTYKIVGIIERPASNIEDYSAPGYTFITYIDENNLDGSIDIFALYTKEGTKNIYKITANILEVNENILAKSFSNESLTEEEINEITMELGKAKYEININTYLVDLETNPLKTSGVGSIGIVASIVMGIIVFTSIFCIKNSFDISITEKIRQYGMLRSIGATKKQIRKNVFYEAFILGIIGIPIGILLGFLASFILIIISNYFLKDMISTGIKLEFSFSYIAVLIAVILGIVTIYFSAFKSAKRASKVSPIDSIRNSANIKINSKKIKSPKIIKKLFGIGGEISYKNLKRNKKKYRTTVISIVVSVFVFIALSSFMTMAFDTIENQLNLTQANISLTATDYKEESYLKFLETTNFDTIEDYTILRQSDFTFKENYYNQEYIDWIKLELDPEMEKHLTIVSLGSEQYNKYIEEIGLDYDEIKNKAILSDYAVVSKYDKEKDKYIKKYMRIYSLNKGDKINGKLENDKNYNLEIGAVTEKMPFGLENNNSRRILVISDELFDEITTSNVLEIYYKSNNAAKLQDEIDEYLKGEDYYLNNSEEQVKIMNNLYTLIGIFLYGFIIVISLIGITNIFNTITTNMELRRQEFAMLKSVGMTSKEFKKMIRLESTFMGVKALIIGVPIGIFLSYLIYYFLVSESGLPYKLPLLAILISIMTVFILISIIMKYSINKISKQNTIETIRNENI